MDVTSTPHSWPVSIEGNDDGTVTIRYAYWDGKAANVVAPADRRGEYDHDFLARLVSAPPPPPKRPGSQ